MKKLLLVLSIAFAASPAKALTNAEQVGVTLATFDVCYVKLNGWHNYAEGFKWGRDMLLDKVEAMPYTSRMQAIDMGEAIQTELNSKITNGSDALKFCEMQYEHYQLGTY
ncbi:hypothetical protein [Vibrio diazotrophicus]|uniref:hypothetical protein n=1 Tax=Vibrio diazotrophicus TaxID=685 RepID=UPI0005A93E26|nr:hypothetical protein [Vibrio diazotrophicus]